MSSMVSHDLPDGITALVGYLRNILSNIKSRVMDSPQGFTEARKYFVQLALGLTASIRQNTPKALLWIQAALHHTQKLLQRHFARVKESLVTADGVGHVEMLRRLLHSSYLALGGLFVSIAKSLRFGETQRTEPPSRQEYQVILVTLPPVHGYGAVTGTSFTPDDKPEALPWDSTDLDAIPPMLPSLHIRRHCALCLMRREIWKSPTTSLAGKFEGQPFWEYHGNDTDYSRGTGWPTDTIRKINGIQDLGIAVSDEDAVTQCTEYYNGLRREWGEYLSIWWNAADFALALACLLVGAAPANTCRQVAERLDKLRSDEIQSQRRQSYRNGIKAGGAFFATGFIGTVLTVGAAAPIALPLVLGVWSWSMGSSFWIGEWSKKERRRESIALLKKSFPDLDRLFGGLDE